MDIQGYFTKKGLLLAAKLAAGSTLNITRVCAGAAETALSASALSQIRQTLSVGAARRSDDTAVLPVTLEAGMAGSAYTLRELGVYAQDPDEGEILYKVYRLSGPVEISPASRLVLRFYLEETVSQDLNVTVVRSSAGLLTEADLDPVRRKVEAASVPSRTVEVEAAELASYIASLPRLLAENLTVEVKGGTSGYMYIERFYGPGSLRIKAKEGETVIFNIQMKIADCRVPVSVEGLSFQGPSSAGTCFHIVNSVAALKGISMTGTNVSGQTGISSTDGGAAYMDGCAFHNFEITVAATRSGAISAESCSGGNNIYGFFAVSGGIILLSGTTPELMGGSLNIKNGGMIVRSNGTPL